MKVAIIHLSDFHIKSGERFERAKINGITPKSGRKTALLFALFTPQSSQNRGTFMELSTP